METRVNYKNDLNLMATELRMGLLGSDDKPSIRNNKRNSPEISEDYSSSKSNSSITMPGNDDQDSPPLAKEQIVGWPPIRSYRRNCLQNTKKNEGEGTGMYVKVSMDGAPYLRKIDLRVKAILNSSRLWKQCSSSPLVNTQKGKGTMDLTMLLLMKTKMVIGCLSEMFPGKCSFAVARD